MIIPQHAEQKLIQQATEMRVKLKLGSSIPVTVQATFEHDWPVEALVQLANRLKEHYIDLEVIMKH